MRVVVVVTLVTVALLTQAPLQLEPQGERRTPEPTDADAPFSAQSYAWARMHDDVAALQAYRPAYPQRRAARRRHDARALFPRV